MDNEYAVLRLTAITEELQAIHDRVCSQKNADNPRYHGLSSAVSGINKAMADMQGG
jgi:hypothetical protein